MKKLVVAAAAALSLAAIGAPAQALVIGAADTANSIPFGSTLGGYYFQQVYSAASFSGALDITQITFYNTQAPASTPLRTGAFQLYLSYSAADIPGFDTTDGVDSPWYDPSFVNVFDGDLPAIVDGRVDFKLSSDFKYDPSKGNLLLTVRDFVLGGGGPVYLDVDRNDGVTNSRFYASGKSNNWNQGLVTGFNDVGAVPEPASWAMMIAGFGMAGAAMRRRRVTA